MFSMLMLKLILMRVVEVSAEDPSQLGMTCTTFTYTFCAVFVPNSSCYSASTSSYCTSNDTDCTCGCDEGYYGSQNLLSCTETPAGYESSSWVNNGNNKVAGPGNTLTSTGVPSADILAYTKIAMSANGRYIIAAANQNFLRYSIDYGISWNTSSMGNIIGLSTTGKQWTGIAMSSDGKYAIASIDMVSRLYSTQNFGQTFSELTNIAIDSKGYAAVACSTNFKNIVTVSRTSGLMLSVNYGINWVVKVAMNVLSGTGDIYNTVSLTCDATCTKICVLVNKANKDPYCSKNGGSNWNFFDTKGGGSKSELVEALVIPPDGSALIMVNPYGYGQIWACTDNGNGCKFGWNKKEFDIEESFSSTVTLTTGASNGNRMLAASDDAFFNVISSIDNFESSTLSTGTRKYTSIALNENNFAVLTTPYYIEFMTFLPNSNKFNTISTFQNGGYCAFCDHSNNVTTNSFMYTRCAEGYYSVKGSGMCRVAGYGHFTANATGHPTTGLTLQNLGYPAVQAIACPKGKYSDVENGTECKICVAGTIAAGTGNRICKICPTGKYGWGAGSNVCHDCDAGTFSTVVGATYKRVCQPCPLGKYAINTGSSFCTDCLPGKYGTVQQSVSPSSCLNCAAGKYSAINGGSSNSSCIDCSSGKYSVSPGSTVCDNCLKGKYASGTGKTVCTNCEAGKYLNTLGADSSSSCIGCPIGTYSVVRGLVDVALCSSCQMGFYNNKVGVTACIPCNQGSYGNTEKATSILSCVSCSKGKYGTTIGATSEATCSSCPAGKYQITVGASVCTSCSGGTYNTNLGETIDSCTNCPIGKYSMEASSACTNCDVGKYGPKEKLSKCIDCIGGKFSNITNATNQNQCLTCNFGTFSQSSSGSCTKCAEGKFSNSAIGAPFCKECPIGKFSDIGASVCFAPTGQPTSQPSSNPTMKFDPTEIIEFNPSKMLVVNDIFLMRKYTLSNIGNYQGFQLMLNLDVAAESYSNNFFIFAEVFYNNEWQLIKQYCKFDECGGALEKTCFRNVEVQKYIDPKNGGTLTVRIKSQNFSNDGPCEDVSTKAKNAYVTLSLTRFVVSPTNIPTQKPTMPSNRTENGDTGLKTAESFSLTDIPIGSSISIILAFAGIIASFGLALNFVIRKKSKLVYQFPFFTTVFGFGLEAADLLSEVFMLQVLFSHREYYKQGFIIVLARISNIVPAFYIFFCIYGPKSFKNWKYGDDWKHLLDEEHLLKEQKMYLNLLFLVL
jgi:hypothetical protein